MKIFEKSEKSPKNLRFYINAVLTYLLIATIVFSAVSFAGYASKAIGSDSARVAKFDVSVAAAQSNEDIELDLSEDSPSGTYAFTVTNNSEVAVNYTIVVSGCPEGVEISVDDSHSLETPRTLAIGAVHNRTLTFTPADDAEGVDPTSVSISIVAEQID
ncbi:MAG: hypothetical protein E7334_09365 [Clostridiales bacterium]|nr:hypothetical protein [Clostridiales bacterium]